MCIKLVISALAGRESMIEGIGSREWGQGLQFEMGLGGSQANQHGEGNTGLNI